eukprot:374502-Pelagomonas_calceolata.AAC.1
MAVICLSPLASLIASHSRPQEYLQFIQGPKPGSDAFAALFPGAMEGQEEATRMGVVSACV